MVDLPTRMVAALTRPSFPVMSSLTLANFQNPRGLFSECMSTMSPTVMGSTPKLLLLYQCDSLSSTMLLIPPLPKSIYGVAEVFHPLG